MSAAILVDDNLTAAIAARKNGNELLVAPVLANGKDVVLVYEKGKLRGWQRGDEVLEFSPTQQAALLHSSIPRDLYASIATWGEVKIRTIHVCCKVIAQQRLIATDVITPDGEYHNHLVNQQLLTAVGFNTLLKAYSWIDLSAYAKQKHAEHALQERLIAVNNSLSAHGSPLWTGAELRRSRWYRFDYSQLGPVNTLRLIDVAGFVPSSDKTRPIYKI